MINKIFIFLFFSSILVSSDLLIKQWVEFNLVTSHYHQPDITDLKKFQNDPFSYDNKDIVLIKDYLKLHYVRNYDIGFSLMSFLDMYIKTPQLKSELLKWLQFAAVIVILLLFLLNHLETFVPFVFIISGGLGNVIDRFYRGYVVDYIEFYWVNSPWLIFKPWPIFNLADILVSIGIILWIIIILYAKKSSKKNYHSLSESYYWYKSFKH